MRYKVKVWKTLSKNDTGETHSHQSGISIIKDIACVGVFPKLGIETLNPRVEIKFLDENNKEWTFQYIYYNDKYHGKPVGKSHDEFRLTRVKDFIKDNSIVSGDSIWFAIDENNQRRIGFDKNSNSESSDVIYANKGWKILKI